MLLSTYRYIRALSLDVVMGSVISCLFLGRYLNVEIPLPILCALGLAVWIIYTVDHLWDARNIDMEKGWSYRHRFHRRHFKTLTVLVAVGVVLGLFLLTQLPRGVVIKGSLLGTLVVVYFVLLKLNGSRPAYFKEIMVAFIYVLGIFMAPITLSQAWIDWPLVLIFLQFLLLALANLLEFSYFEIDSDRRHQFISAVQLWGKATTRRLVMISLMTVTGIAFTSIALWAPDTTIVQSQLILVFMSFCLALIMIRQNYFSVSERFRILGDAIFLFPALLLL